MCNFTLFDRQKSLLVLNARVIRRTVYFFFIFPPLKKLPECGTWIAWADKKFMYGTQVEHLIIDMRINWHITRTFVFSWAVPWSASIQLSAHIRPQHIPVSVRVLCPLILIISWQRISNQGMINDFQLCFTMHCQPRWRAYTLVGRTRSRRTSRSPPVLVDSVRAWSRSSRYSHQKRTAQACHILTWHKLVVKFTNLTFYLIELCAKFRMGYTTHSWNK